MTYMIKERLLFSWRRYHRVVIALVALFAIRLIYIWLTPYKYYFPPPEGVTVNAAHSNDNNPSDTFSPYTFWGVFSFRDVCIEEDLNEPPVLVGENKSTTFKRIVVYNAGYNAHKELSVAASPSTHPHTWPLVLKAEPVPITHNYISTYPAYFVVQSCTGNLYHFWEDTIMGLYGSLELTNRLQGHHGNQVYYRKPDISTYAPHCYSLHRYEQILFALGVRPGQDSFQAATPNTCYSNAVFGWSRTKSEKVSDYVTKHIPMDMSICKPKTITILDRENRRMLNLQDAKKVIEDVGYTNVQIVKFEGMGFMEQYSVIRCTDIFIGVHGAGLQWTIFLRNGRGMLELGMEEFGGLFYTKEYNGYRGIHAMGLIAHKTHLNWDMYSKIHLHGKPVSERTREAIVDRFLKYNSKNPWKWADLEFDMNQFREKFIDLSQKVFD